MMKNKNIILLLVKIVLIVVFAFLINRYIFGFVIVNNNKNKLININPHDVLIYYKLEKNYLNNDIVFYKNKIYRVLGTTGQIINKKGNKVAIDNDLIEEVSYEFNYPYTISSDELFLFGYSEDSRKIGCINKNDINGKLLFRIQIRDF